MNRSFNFDRTLRQLQTVKNRLPTKIGVEALKHFQQSFRDGGFTDANFTAWKPRKTMNKSDRRNPAPRAILVDSGVLKNSGRVKSADWSKVVVGFYGTEYGTYHNQGLGNNPKRQFIGKSVSLLRKVRNLIRDEISTIL